MKIAFAVRVGAAFRNQRLAIRNWQLPSVKVSDVNNLLAELDAEALAHVRTASFDQTPDVCSGRAAFVHNEVAVCRRHACTSECGALQSRPVDQPAGPPRVPVRNP